MEAQEQKKANKKARNARKKANQKANKTIYKETVETSPINFERVGITSCATECSSQPLDNKRRRSLNTIGRGFIGTTKAGKSSAVSALLDRAMPHLLLSWSTREDFLRHIMNRIRVLENEVTLRASSSASRGKPSSMFVLFPKLPTELRLQIWKYAIPGARKITLKRRKNSSQLSVTTPSLTASPYTPDILHVCQESRAMALEYYQVSFAKECTRPMYFNPNQDVVLCLAKEKRSGVLQSQHFFDAIYKSRKPTEI